MTALGRNLLAVSAALLLSACGLFGDDDEELEERQRDHALFISFAPYDEPRIAVALIVENGESGSGVAAPIAKSIMDAYLEYGNDAP